MLAVSPTIDGMASSSLSSPVVVGVLLDGREEHAFHGVTSIENPLPVDERTLFLCGSTTKTFTATAIVRLVGQGRAIGLMPVARQLFGAKGRGLRHF